MPKFAANISMLYNEVPFLERFAAAAIGGFKGVEYVGPYDHPAEEIAALLTKHGLTQVLFNMPAGNWAAGERGFQMDYCVQLAFDNINSPELKGYGVDHVKVVEGLGCKAIRVTEPNQILPALQQAKEWKKQFRVPIVVEIILERVTNISMGTELANVTEFEDLAKGAADAPTAIALLD